MAVDRIIKGRTYRIVDGKGVYPDDTIGKSGIITEIDDTGWGLCPSLRLWLKPDCVSLVHREPAITVTLL